MHPEHQSSQSSQVIDSHRYFPTGEGGPIVLGVDTIPAYRQLWSQLRQGSGAFLTLKRRTRSLTDHVQVARRRLRDLIGQLLEHGLLDEEIRRAFEAEFALSSRDCEEVMANAPVILTHDLTKSYGTSMAVHGLNLSVERNRTTAFLGQNGAGKSTTIKMLLGMIRPTCGDALALVTRSMKALFLRQPNQWVRCSDTEDPRMVHWSPANSCEASVSPP
jgi:ATPase subunit of ABC transporter with duplicated ATPase domains